MAKYFITIIVVSIAVISFTESAHAQWVQTSGPAGQSIRSLLVNGSNLYAATLNGLYMTTDNGDSWNEISIGFPDQVIFCLGVNGNTLFAGMQHGGVYKTSNINAKWREGWAEADSNLPVQSGVNAFTSLDGYFFVATGEDVYGTTDNGTHWIDIYTTPLRGYSSFAVIGNVLLTAGTFNVGIIRSTDYGNSWKSANSGVQSANIYNLGVVGANVYAEADNGVYLSTNAGISWHSVSTGLNSSYTTFDAIASSDNNVFIGAVSTESHNSLFLSTNEGASWALVDSGLTPENIVNALAVCNGYVFAGTESNVWRRPLTDMLTDVKQGTGVSKSFALQQNYPNPFSGQTTIQYFLAEPAPVTLKVYNALGEEVAAPLNGGIKVGAQSVSFNAAALNAGIYYYRITAGKYSQSGKMFVIH
ncbi:MAG TPA: T9SS type A sorting domain-containing protein [Candidatus Kapabacteria bacterium]|nr:T9SS type A sorting domain-containing protein [Candidatus Kapabacteria bacterium]